MSKKFDAVIIGSGQAGTPLASALAGSGRKTALIERSHLGGCCVNEGCTPTKTMIASGRVAYLAKRSSQDYGVWQGTKGEAIQPAVDMEKVRQRKRDIVDRFRGGSERRLKAVNNLEVIVGEASFSDAKSLSVKLAGGDEVNVEAETFFINTGERPARPHLPISDSVDRLRILDSTSIQELAEVPEHLIVLGGGVIGMEFGQLFRRLGSEVTIVQRAKQLLPREDAEVADAVAQICEEDGIRVALNTTASSIDVGKDDKSIVLSIKSASGEDGTVEGSHILLAAGRTPNTDMLNLSNAGVDINKRGHITVSPTLQTSKPHIYALGDVHGGPAFTHISYDDMRIIRANFINQRPNALTTENRQIPYVVYMDPQLAHIGLHEAEARAANPGKLIQTATMPMSYVARALETDETRGLMKAVIDADSKQILGFTILGLEGGEVMSVVQMAMLGKLPYTALQDAVFAHPTLAESLNNLWGYLK